MHTLVVWEHTSSQDAYEETIIHNELSSLGISIVFAWTLKRLEELLPKLPTIDVLCMRPFIYNEPWSQLQWYFMSYCGVSDIPIKLLHLLHQWSNLPSVYEGLSKSIQTIPIFVNRALGESGMDMPGLDNITYFQPNFLNTGNRQMIHWLKQQKLIQTDKANI